MILRRRGIDNAKLLGSIASAIDRIVERSLNGPVGGAGFNPLTGEPSVSQLNYVMPARTAAELQQEQAKPTPTFRGKQPHQQAPRRTGTQTKIIIPGEDRGQQQKRGGGKLPWM